MKNYRITFGGEHINYYDNFSECRKYYPIIKSILDILKKNGINDAWWFFEPYVEITWLCDDELIGNKSLHEVASIFEYTNIPYKTFSPSDGIFGDWHGLTPEEREFGAKRYAQLAKTSQFYYENMDTIEKGMGLEKHFARATHVLANQLGMNYEQEGIALLKRGFLDILFWNLGHEKAVATYEKLFKEKYLGRDEDLSQL